MKTTLLFEFTVNKENNTVNVKREFAENLGLESLDYRRIA